MTELEVVRWLAFAGLSVALFFLKRTLDLVEEKNKELEREIHIIQNEYLHKDDFREFKNELRTMFEEIRKDVRSLQKP